MEDSKVVVPSSMEEDYYTFRRLLLVFVRANYSLYEFLKRIERDENVSKAILSKGNNGRERDYFFAEANDRLLASSVSMTTLVAISGIAMEKYSDQKFFNSFKSLNATIALHPSSLLLRAMRNYIIHGVELPLESAIRFLGSNVETRLTLNTKSFMTILHEDKNLNHDERYFKLERFLKKSEETIDLSPLVYQYVSSMDALWSKFLKDFRDFYRSARLA